MCTQDDQRSRLPHADSPRQGEEVEVRHRSVTDAVPAPSSMTTRSRSPTQPRGSTGRRRWRRRRPEEEGVDEVRGGCCAGTTRPAAAAAAGVTPVSRVRRGLQGAPPPDQAPDGTPGQEGGAGVGNDLIGPIVLG